MVDRQFAYAGAIPQDTDILSSEKNMLYGVGYLAQAALGTGTCVIGLVGAQTAVPSLQITIGAGAIFSQQTVDATAYGDLGADSNTIMKQGILKAPVTLTLTAPTTSGYSQVYLVEAAYQEIDAGATVLPYYNASNPSAPYSGPANAGTSNYTVRQGACTMGVAAGTAAPTGSQTAPATTSGYVPLYTITVANGQTAITTAQIITATGAPFVPYNLNNIPVYPTTTHAFTSSTSWTVPGGITSIKSIKVWGAGAGGGGCSTTAGAGNGGGGGGYAEKTNVAVTPGASITVTVGSGGTGGPSTGGNGASGGASSFGSYCAASGGTNMGAGGVGTTGDLLLTGGGGGTPLVYQYSGTNAAGGGIGGAGALGGSNTPVNQGTPGIAGYFPGGGGSGASGVNIGGTGAGGYIIISY